MVSRKSESVTGQLEAPWQPPPGELRSARQQVAEPQSADPHAGGLPPGPHGEGCPHSQGPQARPSVPDPQTGPGGVLGAASTWWPRGAGLGYVTFLHVRKPLLQLVIHLRTKGKIIHKYNTAK